MRILLSAYSCAPLRGSEPGVGWAFLKAWLQDSDNEVTLLTRKKNSSDIRKNLSTEQLDRVKFLEHDIPFMLWAKRVLPFGTSLYYILWQLSARKVVLVAHSHEKFNFVHHATFTSDSLPVGVSKLKNTKLVIGPIGGFSRIPYKLYKYLGPQGILEEVLRVFLNGISRRVFLFQQIGNADIVLFSNNASYEFFKKKLRNKSAMIWKSVLIPEKFQSPRFRDGSKLTELRIIGIGRLLPAKGWRLALKALSKLSIEWSIDFYGSGPDIRKLEKMASNLRIQKHIKFKGEANRDELLDLIPEYDVALLPSFRDSVGWAVAESLSAGLPVVALNVGGVGEIFGMYGVEAIDPRSHDLISQISEHIESKPLPNSGIQWNFDRYLQIVREIEKQGETKV